MGRPNSRLLGRLKTGITFTGLLVILAGIDWLWSLRASWPRATTDPVPHHCMEAIGVIIMGLYMVSKR
jgi:hypothetical protein